MLNAYVWELYCDSADAKLALEQFGNLADFAGRQSLLWNSLGLQQRMRAHAEGQLWRDEALDTEMVTYISAVRDFAAAREVASPAAVRELLTELVSGDVVFGADNFEPVTLDDPFILMPALSLGLHLAHPETFMPFAFEGIYHLFLQTADTFGLALPPVPPKNDRLERWLYYANICAALQDFRISNDWDTTELLAFLYGFAPDYIMAQPEPELPAPRHAWLLLGHGRGADIEWLNEADADTLGAWQGNLDMQRGDVCVMYVRSPISTTHTVWRVIENGYEDPFFHYKHTVQIGQPKRVPAVHFREMAADEVLGSNKYVRANLQGASGKALSHAEYHRLLDLMAQHGEVPADVPRFPNVEAVPLADLASERDVEMRLVEPLLVRVGLNESDWQRQLPVRMGRGERFYPDYAIGVTGKAPEQRVRALVEVKHRAAGERDWREAFLQAKSYGLRLGAAVVVTAAAEGVRVYERKAGDFHFSAGTEHSWNELQEGEALRQLTRLLRP